MTSWPRRRRSWPPSRASPRINFRGQVLELQDRNGGLVVALVRPYAVAPVASPSASAAVPSAVPSVSDGPVRVGVPPSPSASPSPTPSPSPSPSPSPTPDAGPADRRADGSRLGLDATDRQLRRSAHRAPSATRHDGLPRELVHGHDPGEPRLPLLRPGTDHGPDRPVHARHGDPGHDRPGHHLRRGAGRRDEPDRLERAGQRAGHRRRSAGEQDRGHLDGRQPGLPGRDARATATCSTSARGRPGSRPAGRSGSRPSPRTRRWST